MMHAGASLVCDAGRFDLRAGMYFCVPGRAMSQGDGSGGFVAVESLPLGAVGSSGAVSVADLDGDGRLDVATATA